MSAIGSWDGRRVLVTGASSGIGAALARDLAAAGATLGICARRRDRLEQVRDDCRETGAACTAWAVDLADLDQLDRFADQVRRDLGGIDVLVNNAGMTFARSATETTRADLEALLRVNLLAPVTLTHAVLPGMLAQGSGHVVTVSSMAARMATPGEAAYAASKAALSTYLEALAGELWDTAVSFHVVYPALIDVTGTADGDDDLAARSDGATPIPAPVCARAIRRQLEHGDAELYVPRTMRGVVAERFKDVPASVEFMAGWYRDGGTHR